MKLFKIKRVGTGCYEMVLNSRIYAIDKQLNGGWRIVIMASGKYFFESKYFDTASSLREAKEMILEKQGT